MRNAGGRGRTRAVRRELAGGLVALALAAACIRSGGRPRHRSGSKAGNRYFKLAFSHAGIRAVQYYPEIPAFFTATAGWKPIKIARTLVALELARIVYAVLTKQEAFNATFKHQPLSRRKHAQWPRRASPPA